MENSDWPQVRDRALNVLRLDPDNADALAFLAAAQRDLGGSLFGSSGLPESEQTAPSSAPPAAPASSEPASFANGRYEIKKSFGQGGKKKVYLAHDVLLDRDVAFSLIKTEGLDDVARSRISREAQAMGRLGSHPHIVTVFDLGEHPSPPEAMGDGPSLIWLPSLWADATLKV